MDLVVLAAAGRPGHSLGESAVGAYTLPTRAQREREERPTHAWTLYWIVLREPATSTSCAGARAAPSSSIADDAAKLNGLPRGLPAAAAAAGRPAVGAGSAGGLAIGRRR